MALSGSSKWTLLLLLAIALYGSYMVYSRWLIMATAPEQAASGTVPGNVPEEAQDMAAYPALDNAALFSLNNAPLLDDLQTEVQGDDARLPVLRQGYSLQGILFNAAHPDESVATIRGGSGQSKTGSANTRIDGQTRILKIYAQFVVVEYQGARYKLLLDTDRHRKTPLFTQ